MSVKKLLILLLTSLLFTSCSTVSKKSELKPEKKVSLKKELESLLMSRRLVPLNTNKSLGLIDIAQNIDAELKKKKPYHTFIFFSAYCPCSGSHMNWQLEVAKRFSKISHFYFINSNTHETVEDSLGYMKTLQIPKDSFFFQDLDSKLALRLGALKTPHVFIYSPQEELIYAGGATNSNALEKADEKYLEVVLTELAKGNPAPYQYKKAKGCGITLL